MILLAIHTTSLTVSSANSHDWSSLRLNHWHHSSIDLYALMFEFRGYQVGSTFCVAYSTTHFCYTFNMSAWLLKPFVTFDNHFLTPMGEFHILMIWSPFSFVVASIPILWTSLQHVHPHLGHHLSSLHCIFGLLGWILQLYYHHSWQHLSWPHFRNQVNLRVWYRCP